MKTTRATTAACYLISLLASSPTSIVLAGEQPQQQKQEAEVIRATPTTKAIIPEDFDWDSEFHTLPGSESIYAGTFNKRL